MAARDGSRDRTYSGTLTVGQPVTFDASCSTGTGPLEYAWTFGDYTPTTAAVGLLSAAGVCVPLPATRAARQAAHNAVFATGRWPVLCALAVP